MRTIVSFAQFGRTLILCSALISALSFLTIPSTTRAASFLTDLVPCGDDVQVSGDSASGYTYCNECSVCHLQQLAQRVLNFLVGFMTVMATLLFVNAGILYVTAPTNPSAVSKAHSIFKNTLIGILIILAAYLLVDFALKKLLGGEGDIMEFGPWNKVLCTGSSEDCRFVPPMTQITLKAEELTLGEAVRQGLTCTKSGLDCRADCGTDFFPVPQFNSTCGSGQQCCKFKDSKVGNTCTVDTSKKGVCVSTGAQCATAKYSADCGTIPCCLSVTEPVVPKKDGEYDCNDMASLKEEFGGAGPVNGPGMDALLNCIMSDPTVASLKDGQNIYTHELTLPQAWQNPTCDYTNGDSVCERKLGRGTCSHSEGSCHYGRGTGVGSLGADFNAKSGKEAELFTAIKAAIEKNGCAGRAALEADHTHVSHATCPGR